MFSSLFFTSNFYSCFAWTAEATWYDVFGIIRGFLFDIYGAFRAIADVPQIYNENRNWKSYIDTFAFVQVTKKHEGVGRGEGCCHQGNCYDFMKSFLTFRARTERHSTADLITQTGSFTLPTKQKSFSKEFFSKIEILWREA